MNTCKAGHLRDVVQTHFPNFLTQHPWEYGIVLWVSDVTTAMSSCAALGRGERALGASRGLMSLLKTTAAHQVLKGREASVGWDELIEIMTSDNFQLQVAELENTPGCVVLQSTCPQLRWCLTLNRVNQGSLNRRKKPCLCQMCNLHSSEGLPRPQLMIPHFKLFKIPVSERCPTIPLKVHLTPPSTCQRQSCLPAVFFVFSISLLTLSWCVLFATSLPVLEYQLHRGRES